MTSEFPRHDQRYYQVVLIKMKDPERFARYLELMAPIVHRYGGALERALLPETVYAQGVAKPDTINVVHYHNRDAYTAFNADPEFQAIAHLRSESVDMVAVGGRPVRGEVVESGIGDRLYVVEFARFGGGGGVGYRTYEEQSEAIMSRYGYHVERVIAPDAIAGLPFTPNIVKVAYFDAHDGMDRMHQDPAHERLERELYPAAVAESIWMVARVHPSSQAKQQPGI